MSRSIQNYSKLFETIQESQNLSLSVRYISLMTELFCSTETNNVIRSRNCPFRPFAWGFQQIKPIRSHASIYTNSPFGHFVTHMTLKWGWFCSIESVMMTRWPNELSQSKPVYQPTSMCHLGIFERTWL